MRITDGSLDRLSTEWRVEREPHGILALYRRGTAQPYRYEPGEVVHALLSSLFETSKQPVGVIAAR